MWEICCGDLLYARLCMRFTFIGPKERRDVDAANRSVKNPSFIANFSRARTRFCIALNYEEPSDKRWNIYILFWVLNKTGNTLRAHSRSHMSFSSGRVSQCAVIRDDHLRCYYLDNARCIASRGNTYGSQPGQWITLEESAPSSPFVPLPLLRRCCSLLLLFLL